MANQLGTVAMHKITPKPKENIKKSQFGSTFSNGKALDSNAEFDLGYVLRRAASVNAIQRIIHRRDGQEYDNSTSKLPSMERLQNVDSHTLQAKSATKLHTENIFSHAEHGFRGSPRLLPYAEYIQGMFGNHNIMNVKSYIGGPAADACDAIGANAYTLGNRVAFKHAPSLHTAAHEAAHVIQQRRSLQLDCGVGERGDVYERHADQVADTVVQGHSSESLLSSMPDTGLKTYEVHDKNLVTTSNEDSSLSSGGGGHPIQLDINTSVHAIHGALQLKGGEEKTDQDYFIPYEITIDREMNREEFLHEVERQVFNGLVPLKYVHSSTNTVFRPEDNPHRVGVKASAVKSFRGEVNIDKGIEVGEGGEIVGARKRAQKFHASYGAEAQSLMTEIDRRYYEASGVKPGTKIKEEEKGRAQLWRMIRDEVLFQHEYLSNLPPEVKKLIKFSIQGRELTPLDYEQLFRIAKKIESMKSAGVSDYASKINASTTDLNVFEKSVDDYIVESAKRKKLQSEREVVKVNLLGLEDVYQMYRSYLISLGIEGMSPLGTIVRLAELATGDDIAALPSSSMRKKLEIELKKHGINSVVEFANFVAEFESGFVQASAIYIDDVLAKYRSKLYSEAERYKDQAQVAAVHKKLGGVKTQYKEYKKYHTKAEALRMSRMMAMHPGAMYLLKPSEEEAFQKQQAEKFGQATEGELETLGKTNPVFQEQHLPEDRKIDKDKLASVDIKGLQELLLSHIANKIIDVEEALTRVRSENEVIYKMDKMFPQFYAQQGIVPGSIYDMIIQDRIKDDAIKNLIIGILTAIVAIALTIVSLGTATPALVAAGAAAGAFGLSAYMAYEEFQQYAKEKDLADVGLADDPTMVWLVVAVVGAVVDLGAAAKALKALGPAADVLKATGNVDEFSKAVQLLQKAGKLERKVAEAAEQAARARQAFKEASADLAKTLSSKAYAFPPGPFADPDVYKALVKMARAKLKEGASSIVEWYNHVKKLRLDAKLGNLTPEELAKLKDAWEEAKVLEAIGAESNVAQVKLLSGGSAVHPKVPPYTGGKTEGIFQFKGAEVPLQSGETGPGRWLIENLPGGKGSGLTRSWTHVEGHAAGIMQKHGLKYAELFINQIPCSTGAAKCQAVISKLLPKDSKLVVHFLKADGTVGSGVFEAGVPGFRILSP